MTTQTTNARYQAIQLGADKRPSNGTVIAEGPTAESVDHLWQAGHVIIAWTYDAPEPRRLSKASLASVRRKRLMRRLERKHPLLADLLFAETIAARPAFYAGERTQEQTQ